MREPRPSDIALPPTVSVDLSHLVTAAVALSAAESRDDSDRAA